MNGRVAKKPSVYMTLGFFLSHDNLLNMDGVTTIKGKERGRILTIMAGVHGNERTGLMAFDILEKTLKIDAGTVHLVRANPWAIRQNKRFIESNMNRAFSLSNPAKNREDMRTLEIMKLLDESDALLDLHNYNDDSGEPFVITDDSSEALARIFDASFISSGWDAIHKGSSDEYMHSKGKLAVCIECGPTSKSDERVPFAIDSIKRFLSYFSAIRFNFEKPQNQRFVSVVRSIRSKTADFRFARDFKSFEPLKKGELVAIDGDEKYAAGDAEIIIFPRNGLPVGSEVAILGRYKS